MKNLLKKTVIILLLTFSAASANAAGADVFNYPVDPNNMAQFKNNFVRPQFLRGNFTQTKVLKEINRKFVTKGEFVFSIKDGLAWKTKEPFENNLIFTRDKLIKVEADGTKTVLDNNQAAFQEISGIFQALFSADYVKLEEYFKIYLAKDQNKWIIGLKPNSETISQVVNRITLRFGTTVEQILLEEENGDYTLIEFSNVKTR